MRIPCHRLWRCKVLELRAFSRFWRCTGGSPRRAGKMTGSSCRVAAPGKPQGAGGERGSTSPGLMDGSYAQQRVRAGLDQSSVPISTKGRNRPTQGLGCEQARPDASTKFPPHRRSRRTNRENGSAGSCPAPSPHRGGPIRAGHGPGSGFGPPGRPNASALGRGRAYAMRGSRWAYARRNATSTASGVSALANRKPR